MDESLNEFKRSEKMEPFIKEFGKKFTFYDKNNVLENYKVKNPLINPEMENSVCLGQVAKQKLGSHWK
jgi:hypothetical protein